MDTASPQPCCTRCLRPPTSLLRRPWPDLAVFGLHHCSPAVHGLLSPSPSMPVSGHLWLPTLPRRPSPALPAPPSVVSSPFVASHIISLPFLTCLCCPWPLTSLHCRPCRRPW